MTKTILLLLALAAVPALAQQPPTKSSEQQARTYITSAFMTGAAPMILSDDVVVQPELRQRLALPADANSRTLYQALVDGDEEAVRQLVTPHVETMVQRASFLDRVVGDALRKIGKKWECGELSVDVEHRASFIVADAVDRLRPRTMPRDAALAVLACPPTEAHDLPLRLVRLVFEWCGWRTEFLGAELPWNDATRAIERDAPRVIAFSARTSEPFHHDDFAALVERCAARSTIVITGGEWARGGQAVERGYYRFRSLRGFEKWLRNQ